MKSYISSKAKIKKSPISKFGLFAIKNFKKGELIGIKNGKIINKKEFKKLGEFDSDIGKAVLQIDEKFYIGPTNRKEIKESMMHVNHSCHPNVGIMGSIISIALRDIKAGEELMNDYATWLDDPQFKMKCRCGSKKCRKIITGKDWQKLDLQRKYKGYFSSYLQRKIEKIQSQFIGVS